MDNNFRHGHCICLGPIWLDLLVYSLYLPFKARRFCYNFLFLVVISAFYLSLFNGSFQNLDQNGTHSLAMMILYFVDSSGVR